LEKLDVIIVNGRKVYSFYHDLNDLSKQLKDENENQAKVNVIQRDNDKTYIPYYIELDTTADMLSKYTSEYYPMGISGEKLKAVSAYKVEELKDIVAQLGLKLDNEKKMLKKDLYELIVKNI
jgi:uncharacterized protein YgfB (UPF0149 family)